MQKLAVIGSGYVGLVSGTCMADLGMKVTCVDNDKGKIEQLKLGQVPIYEPGLDELIGRNVYYNKLFFSSDIRSAVEENDIIFIAVGTPPKEDGSVDLTYVEEVASEIGRYMNGYKVIVNKSTVPVGTGQKVKTIIEETLKGREVDFNFDIVSNPEFLREGSAIYDFTHPDRVIIGAESEKAIKLMKEVYRVLYLYETPFLITSIETSELIKYASNAFLAAKISFVNELTELCEKVGADIKHVSKGMGMDKRIGEAFLHAGPGYGGSCFPKDTCGLVSIASNLHCNMNIVKATIEANEKQKKRMFYKIQHEMGKLDNKVVAILGLTFKPNTDDMRESPALYIIDNLILSGTKVKVYDPQATKELVVKSVEIKDGIEFCKNEYEAIEGADCLVIVTEWNQFRNLDLNKIKETMRGSHFFDLRNIYNPHLVRSAGLQYVSNGRGNLNNSIEEIHYRTDELIDQVAFSNYDK